MLYQIGNLVSAKLWVRIIVEAFLHSRDSARFDIGFPLPENKDKGDIAGYHCWAEFYARKTGWIPVDISEAWKAKQKEDYFFGSVDANRVQLSTGRDIALSPKQGWSSAQLLRLPVCRGRR